MRVLYVSSERRGWFEDQSCAVHFEHAPYSLGAIGYNLEKLGWVVGWCGWKSSRNPFKLAKRIDEFKPDIIYTYGSTVALHPLFCRRFLCRHKAFKVVHGWDDPYGRIYNDLFGWPGKVLMNWMEKRIITNSDAVVTLSYALQKKGREWDVECKYIPNGADSVDPSQVKGNIKLTGRFNLVYTGDKAPWKLANLICEAMGRVPKDIKFYTTGAKANYLDPYWSENCIDLGWVSKEEQWNVMSQADAFVVTSNQDCNAKLQEYLRWGKPILAYDGEANNFFKNGRNAILTKDFAPAVLKLANDPALCAELAKNAAADIPVYNWYEIAQQFDVYFKELIVPSCGKDSDVVLYPHASESDNLVHDQRNFRGGVHPFATAREQVRADLGGVRMLAAEVSTELLRTVQHGERASVSEVSSALVASAMKLGLYVPPTDREKFGDLKRRRSGESEIYAGTDFSTLVKFKDPQAKQSLKRTVPGDWLYEHVIHNVLFPESCYEFMGISEAAGTVRIVLRQTNVNALERPTDERIAADMKALGLAQEDRYYFGNDVLAVTDIGAMSDNVLQGCDGKTFYIDPLIRLKRPALEVIEWLVGDLSE